MKDSKLQEKRLFVQLLQIKNLMFYLFFLFDLVPNPDSQTQSDSDPVRIRNTRLCLEMSYL
jgi:hypothetical protein